MSERYRELTAKVDAFFTRVRTRHATDMRCGSGCDSCCRTRLTITGVEAQALRAHVTAMPDDERARLAEVARRPYDPADMRCAALEDDGRCLVYDGRPIVCRSHGVPVRVYGEANGRRFPIIDSCPLNFATGPERADPDCILDQETLSATLIAIDAEDADARGRERGQRVPLAELLVELTESQKSQTS
jgi:Fe-S-cluster containining protein